MPKKNELIIILIIIVLLFSIMLAAPNENGESVRVYFDGQLVGTYPLEVDDSISVSGVEISIASGSAVVEYSSCPGQDCMKSKPINKAGQSIVCLPNRVIISVSGQSDTDTVSY